MIRRSPGDLSRSVHKPGREVGNSAHRLTNSQEAPLCCLSQLHRFGGGYPAFISMVVVYFLMVMKPEFS